MAILKNGILGPIVGKIGDAVGYIRMGQPCLRAKPRKKAKRSKHRTPNQQAAGRAFAVVSEFVTPINEFINTGFKLETAGTAKVPRNAAMSYNMAAVTGQFPDQKFDYSKGVVTVGRLPGVDNARVALGEWDSLEMTFSLKFDWDIDPGLARERKRDQVMMLAFFPETGKAQFCLSGNRRAEGSDTLFIRPKYDPGKKILSNTYVETYMAFIADDRESISMSIYTGRILLTT